MLGFLPLSVVSSLGSTGSGFLVVSGKYISWRRSGDMSEKPWPEGSV